MRKATYKVPQPPANHKNFNYQIQTKSYKDGFWIITYKKWPEGECFCLAEELTIELKQHWQPRTVDITEAEKTLNVGE